MGASMITVVALDFGGYAATFLLSQLSLWVTVSLICSPAPWSWNLGRLRMGLSCLGGTGEVLLFKAELARLGEVPGVGGGAAAVLSRAGAAEGQMFVLGPDGSYDVELNRFLRELDGWGVRSPNSARAYARDLALFGRFLAERRAGRASGSPGRKTCGLTGEPAGPGRARCRWERGTGSSPRWTSGPGGRSTRS